MTICIASICLVPPEISGTALHAVVGASDRMLTIEEDDVQFEVTATHNNLHPVLKTVFIARNVAMMTAGDAALQADLIQELGFGLGSDRMKASPKIRDVASQYSRLCERARLEAINKQLLSPFGLDSESFISKQKQLKDDLVDRLSSKMLNYGLGVAAIFAGVDESGPHIYVADECGISCFDSIGYAAIGSGRRHAQSQFQLANYSRAASLVESVFLTYVAKKRSEKAPGVGKETDMFWVGYNSGCMWIQSPAIGPLQAAYEELEREQDSVYKGIQSRLRRQLDEEIKRAKEAQTPAPPETPPSPAPPSEE